MWVGVDTRPSAAELRAAAEAGIAAVGGMAVDCGVLTTPQLHWLVANAANRGWDADLSRYYAALAEGYQSLVHGTPVLPEVHCEGIHVPWQSTCFQVSSCLLVVVKGEYMLPSKVKSLTTERLG